MDDKTITGMDLIDRADAHGSRVAIVDATGSYTYASLASASMAGARTLLGAQDDLGEKRVAFMIPAGFGYAAVLWSIWRAGGIAVPLSLHHPLPEIEYVLEDTGASIVIAGESYVEKVKPLAKARGLRFISGDLIAKGAGDRALPTVAASRRALILYTSGTTSRPKGVVTTHANITSQITCLIEAWGWLEDDQILHVLPLHHTHGIVNVLLCALWVGAVCRMLPAFEPRIVWKTIAAQPLTLFMAVPTIYSRLIAHWEQATPAERERWSEACRKMRLMVSGSAALPVSVLERWRYISGHTLLERYGMTEIGMALTNPLVGERRPGSVGVPVPRMEVKLVGEDEHMIEAEGMPGEIRVRGPNVFLEYWNRPDATREAFKDGWFCTGDIAVRVDGYYRILGRQSVDIIKTGGYKVSALEIEEVLRTCPAIRECAVVGVEDDEWGERVCVGVVFTDEMTLTIDELRAWSKERLAPYKIPTRMIVLDELPRNALGKVTKPAFKAMFQD